MVEILRILVAKRRVRTMAAVVEIQIHVLTICTFHIHILSQIIFIRLFLGNYIKPTYIHGILGILN